MQTGDRRTERGSGDKDKEEAWYRRAFGRAYFDVYPHRDKVEARALVGLLKQHAFLDGTPVLDLGCGPGRHITALMEAGVSRVVGIDLSETLLRSAWSEIEHGGARPLLVRADWRDLPLASRCFPLVLSLFTSFGYFDDPADDERHLEEVARVLTDEGVFVLDYLNANRVRMGLPSESRRLAGDLRVEEKRRLSSDGRRVVKDVVLSSTESGTELHRHTERVNLYSQEDLLLSLEKTGFHVDTVWGDYEGTRFDREKSSRLILVGRRTITDDGYTG